MSEWAATQAPEAKNLMRCLGYKEEKDKKDGIVLGSWLEISVQETGILSSRWKYQNQPNGEYFFIP